MHIDTAAGGKREDCRRQNTPERRNRNQVRFPPSQSVKKFRILHLERLQQRNLFLLGQKFHR